MQVIVAYNKESIPSLEKAVRVANEFMAIKKQIARVTDNLIDKKKWFKHINDERRRIEDKLDNVLSYVEYIRAQKEKKQKKRRRLSSPSDSDSDSDSESLSESDSESEYESNSDSESESDSESLSDSDSDSESPPHQTQCTVQRK